MLVQHLFDRVTQGLARDSQLSLAEKLHKGFRLLSDTARAQVALRACTRVGPGARLSGSAVVDNHGTITLGKDLVLHGTFLPIELIAGPDAVLEIGDGVWINFGAVIAASRSVRIGKGVMLGQHCIVSDVDVPESAARRSTADARPVEIDDQAWLAGRVTVLPGARIGARAVITAGSIVEGEIPPDVVAGGSPARVLRAVNGAHTNGVSVSVPGAPAAVAEAPSSGARPVEATERARFNGTLVADSTIDELADELRAAGLAGGVDAIVAPFGQVAQVLLNPPDSGAADFAVVWTRPEMAVQSFARVLAFEEVDERELLDQVDAFCALIKQAAASYRFVFVPTWVIPPWIRGLGLLDGRKGGVARALLAMNLRLSDALRDVSNAYVLDAERWFRSAGRSAANPRGWYLGKVAVPRPVLAEAASDIAAALSGLSGGARKLLVVDLDDTLWGGIVGDVGWEGLRLGGHDSLGESFVDFQRALKNLTRRGIVLAIVSKNEESVALEAIENHPEMVLKKPDFVGWRINWIDKARNIADLAAELNLGLQSTVFIDDNPVERARVREALPEVYVPDWPEDKLLYTSTLHRLRCFDQPAVSQEDLERTRLYAEERERDELQKQVGSIDEWLKSLQIKVAAERLGPQNITRAAQLLNKTNQLNLTTRRLSEAELLEWASAPNRAFWTIKVSDRFGDAGLTGLLGVEREGSTLTIVDYVLSCRVMGRKVEETMVHMAVSAAASVPGTLVVAEYKPTAKNKPCLSFWKSSGFANGDDSRFTWDTAAPYPLPEPISLSWQR